MVAAKTAIPAIPTSKNKTGDGSGVVVGQEGFVGCVGCVGTQFGVAALEVAGRLVAPEMAGENVRSPLPAANDGAADRDDATKAIARVTPSFLMKVFMDLS